MYLIKQLIIFGNYKMKINNNDTRKITLTNEPFLNLLKVSISIFEIDLSYPEAIFIMIEKRNEKKKRKEKESS